MYRYIQGQEVPHVGDSDPSTWFRRTRKGRYVSVRHTSVELEKRPKNSKDGCPVTGWYLFAPGHFGTWCGSGIIAAVQEANRLVSEEEE